VSSEQFYDGLADTYHALYPDWHGQTRIQGEALHRLLRSWHTGPIDIADVACGIGTQMIGLARHRHRVFGSDTSVRAVQRARRECASADVSARLAVADTRSLPLADSCVDAVVCADNALPHLLTDGDVRTALAQMGRILRPGGAVILSTRDYDRIVADPPTGSQPQVYHSDSGRIISFQLWAWREGTDIYDLEHFQVHETANDGGLITQRRTATYRAYTREALTGLASSIGLQQIAWHMPDQTSFFQPIMTARKLT
jgi:glycine/sarcosine N-methyltransferase